jgi:hypothetical protein
VGSHEQYEQDRACGGQNDGADLQKEGEDAHGASECPGMFSGTR